MRGHGWSKRKKKTVKKSVKEDRLSALPDELIYHIFSFLDMREVVNTSLISNKWRYLWRSTPTLIFDNHALDCWYDTCGCRRKDCKCKECLLQRGRFKSFVKDVFVRGSSNLVKFQLIDFYKVSPRLVSKWVDAALERKVQDVDISIDLTKVLLLPDSLFGSNAKVLKLRLRCDARVPNLLCAAAWIKNLYLEYVKLPDGNTNGELDLSFPVLESLVIDDCDVNHLKIISISTPALEILKLSGFNPDNYSSCKVRTYTPNLKSLTVYDYVYVYDSVVEYHMENLSSLVSADICVCSASSKCVVECLKRLMEAVTWMYNVQDLKLRVFNVQFLPDSTELLERLPGVFNNLKHVILDMDRNKTFHMQLKFLERAPHLETLILQAEDPAQGWYFYDKFEEGQTAEEWTEEKWIQSPASFNHLIFFEMRNFNGLDVEMRFLEFVLEKARVLKKMIIKTKKEPVPDKSKEEILSYSRSSSSVSISFLISRVGR